MDAGTTGTPADSVVSAQSWNALKQGTILLDRSSRIRMRFTGPKAAEALTGLVTSNVLALTPGRGQYAAALTAKGKVLADVRIFARADGPLVDANASAGPGFVAMIRKYVNPRLAKYEDVSATTADLGFFGGGALAMLRGVFGEAVVPVDLPAFGHIDATVDGEPVMVARVPDFGVDGFDVIGTPASLESLRRQVLALGAVESTDDALHVARIEAGRPEWGIDMDDSMLAQEADLDRLEAISFTKGCYTGQETVARVHYRGHVNRHLRGLRFHEPVLPPVGTELEDLEGKSVGVVRSGAVSPGRGAIALALVRREIEPGTVLRVTWSGRTVDADVTSLPFGD